MSGETLRSAVNARITGVVALKTGSARNSPAMRTNASHASARFDTPEASRLNRDLAAISVMPSGSGRTSS